MPKGFQKPKHLLDEGFRKKKKQANERRGIQRSDAKWKPDKAIPFVKAVCANCKFFDRLDVDPKVGWGYCTFGHVRFGFSQTFNKRELKVAYDAGYCDFWRHKYFDDPTQPDTRIKVPIVGDGK